MAEKKNHLFVSVVDGSCCCLDFAVWERCDPSQAGIVCLFACFPFFFSFLEAGLKNIFVKMHHSDVSVNQLLMLFAFLLSANLFIKNVLLL